MSLPTFADVQAAAGRIAGLAERTPLLHSAALDQVVGGRVLVKAEVLQRTGSFKFRGAYNRLSQLDDRQREVGVVAFSSGNHAQGVAEAARLVGCPSVIVMPSDAPAVKLDATRRMGAEVVLYDRFTESREAIAVALAAERGAVLVPSYDDPHIIAGQGTVGLEVGQQLEGRGESADQLLCPASGGGLIAGTSLALGALSPTTRVVVVEPAGFDDHGRSLAAGRRVANVAGARSVCDALLASEPGELTFAINRERLAGAASVTDEEVFVAMRTAFALLKIVIEPGGAVALAALLSGAVDGRGKTSVVVASGGNVDPELYTRVIA